MYQEVLFNRGTEAGGGGEGGVNVGHSLIPPSHFMLATGLEPILKSQRGFLKLFRIEKTLKRRLKFQTKYHDALNFTFNKFV